MAARLDRGPQFLSCPCNHIVCLDGFKRVLDEFLGRLGDGSGHPEHHFREAATTLLPLQPFALSDQRLQDFATRWQPFAWQNARGLLGNEFHHTVR